MILGQVIGSYWSTAQHKSFDGKRLVMVDPWDALTGVAKGSTLLAVDAVGCRNGDVVMILYEGGGARQVMEDKTCPAEAVVVGIVDRLDVDYTEG